MCKADNVTQQIHEMQSELGYSPHNSAVSDTKKALLIEDAQRNAVMWRKIEGFVQACTTHEANVLSIFNLCKDKDTNTFKSLCCAFEPFVNLMDPRRMGTMVFSVDAAFSNHPDFVGRYVVFSSKDKELGDNCIAFAFSNEEDFDIYDLVFKCVHDVFQKASLRDYMRDRVERPIFLTDWGKAIKKALEHHYPHCIHLRCLRHVYHK